MTPATTRTTPTPPTSWTTTTRATWRNWAGTVENRDVALAMPATVDEVVALVRHALAVGSPLRVVGGGHSWSDLTRHPRGVLVSLDRLCGLRSVDVARRQVTVNAGTRLRDLHELLDAQGLALSSLGSIPHQSVAGVTCTSTHGSGAGFGSLSTAVAALELVDGTGAVRTLSATDDADAFAAARCSLGALGVITAVTLQCEPAFRLESHEELRPVDDVVRDLDRLVADNEHVKVWWLPHTDRCVVFRHNRTTKPRHRPALGRWFRDELVKNALFHAGVYSTSFVPPLVRQWQRLTAALAPRHHTFVDRSDRVFHFPVHIPHLESEHAFDRAHVVEAFAAFRRLVNDGPHHVGFISELRFVRGDDVWLSPLYGRDSAYLGTLQYHRLPWRPLFDDVERLLAPYGARPHWGKLHSLTSTELRALYPRFDDFLAVRARLDPRGVFVGPHHERLLGVSSSMT